MEIGIVGLGRMGASMARRLARGGAQVVAYDRDRAAREALGGENRIESVEGLAALAARLGGERVILTMLPAGAPTEETLAELLSLLSAGDMLVDGGNAYYKDTM
ncbi:MAG TPA: NAD(P)-binding domain-containing protein, partial [Burkholderiales bacterium]|nr:NAD(P)-binding domain-containing protein [Burkholderiales bacterium]